MRLVCDDTAKKKVGRHSARSDRYRNGASSTRQAYRTLHGFNVVLGMSKFIDVMGRLAYLIRR
jgi:hypothetical protein